MKLKNIMPYLDMSQGLKILNYYGNELTDKDGKVVTLYRRWGDIERMNLFNKEISAITVDSNVTGRYGSGTLTIYLEKEV